MKNDKHLQAGKPIFSPEGNDAAGIVDRENLVCHTLAAGLDAAGDAAERLAPCCGDAAPFVEAVGAGCEVASDICWGIGWVSSCF